MPKCPLPDPKSTSPCPNFGSGGSRPQLAFWILSEADSISSGLGVTSVAQMARIDGPCLSISHELMAGLHQKLSQIQSWGSHLMPKRCIHRRFSSLSIPEKSGRSGGRFGSSLSWSSKGNAPEGVPFSKVGVANWIFTNPIQTIETNTVQKTGESIQYSKQEQPTDPFALT